MLVILLFKQFLRKIIGKITLFSVGVHIEKENIFSHEERVRKSWTKRAKFQYVFKKLSMRNGDTFSELSQLVR